jgi:hypothetical protein
MAPFADATIYEMEQRNEFGPIRADLIGNGHDLQSVLRQDRFYGAYVRRAILTLEPPKKKAAPKKPS